MGGVPELPGVICGDPISIIDETGVQEMFRRSGFLHVFEVGKAIMILSLLTLAGHFCFMGQAQAVATPVLVTGEIDRIILDNPGDFWSGGLIQVGGDNVIIPRNLLMDLPANRLTLYQLFEQASAACLTAAETGLAKADTCNTSGQRGFATIHANRTAEGNVIAGDVFIQKGVEAVMGVITYIDYNDGYFRINGDPASPASTTRTAATRYNRDSAAMRVARGSTAARISASRSILTTTQTSSRPATRSASRARFREPFRTSWVSV